MGNPYPANFETPAGAGRLTGQINFTDAANQPGGSVRTASLDLTSAQIKALNSTPVQVVAAPGTGKFIAPISMIGQLKFGTVAYVSPGDFHLNYAGHTDQSIITLSGIDWLPATQSMTQTGNIQQAFIEQTHAENAALQVNVDTGNPTTGDGIIRVVVVYCVFDLA